MLENHVAPFTPLGARSWNGIATTCHMATLYWMLTAIGRPPNTANDIAGYNITMLLRDIGLAGTRVYPGNVQANHRHMTPGSVIVFMRPDLQTAGHSCVLKTNLTVGGYNQNTWFTTAGNDHYYSEHDLDTELRWVDRGLLPNRRVCVSNGTEYYLYATDDGTALQHLRQARG